jgi:3'-5' exoribonuclease
MNPLQSKKISDFKDKDLVETNYLVSEKYLGTGKNGKPFLAVKLSDVSGVLDARLWDKVEEVSRTFEVGQIVGVRGNIQIFQGRKQLVLHRIELSHGDHQVEAFMPQGQTDAKDNFARLIAVVTQTKNIHLRQLMMDTLEDPEVKSLLLRAPAARSIHHAWMGGLLEHILSICTLMEYLALHYKFLNRDLLVFGGLFHDLGKIWELSVDKGIQYTHKGRLLGHMLLGCELVDRKAQRILGFPEDLKDICKHIILSHHGKYEYGSPKRPKFLEAAVVAMVDDMDSKISNIHAFIEMERSQLISTAENGVPERWSKYNEIHDRYFLLDDFNVKLES